MLRGSRNLYSVSCCRSYIAPPPPTLIHTHTHTPLTHTHVCTHCNTTLTLHLCDCHPVNENIRLTYFSMSKIFIFVQQMHTADWIASKALNFETVCQNRVVRLWNGLTVVCFVVGGEQIQQIENKEKTLYEEAEQKKPCVVRIELAAVSDLTSEPLSSCMPLSLPACLTACLSPVSLLAPLFAWLPVFSIIWRCTKAKGWHIKGAGSSFHHMHFHTHWGM